MSYLITNRTGGYALIGTRSFSRYSGIFFREKKSTFKVIDDIKIKRSPKSLNSNYWMIERKYPEVTQRYCMVHGFNAITYDLDKEFESEIVLDCKESYDNRSFGRFYDIQEEDGKIIITYTKKTNLEEDETENKTEYKIYVVIKPDSLQYNEIKEFIHKDYGLDRRRGSTPSDRHVFSALKIKTKKMAIAFSLDKERALYDADFVFKNMKSLKNLEKTYHTALLKNTKTKKATLTKALKHAVVSYDQLLTNVDARKGIYAGLPWFFQYWSRDESISLKAANLIGKNNTAKSIFFTILGRMQEDGNIANRLPPTDLGCADAVGWLFKRADSILPTLSPIEKKEVEKKLQNAISRLLKSSTNNTLATNTAQETWMDTVYQNDTREGSRIEIQAGRLNMYHLMHKISKKKIYKDLELRLKKKVRDQFWNKNFLADGSTDQTIRPNIFIAHYLYPQLLSNAEWTRCFTFALKQLWLDWGGLSTISKSHQLYQTEHSGEVPNSYHRGDSWFWINNLAALSLHKVNKKKFRHYIDKLTKASCKDILKLGIIGSHAELSSASELKSQGCLSQAWSLAMFIELAKEIS
jgi:glycogen debranching enzyme